MQQAGCSCGETKTGVKEPGMSVIAKAWLELKSSVEGHRVQVEGR